MVNTTDAGLHVELAGEAGPRLLLVHGSGSPGWAAFEAQRPLAERYRLIIPHRSGYPPNRPLDRIDFEEQAEEIGQLVDSETHLVGHSYGGVVSLLVAAMVGDRLASLTVIEPPAFAVARGHPAVEGIIERLTPIFAEPGDPRDFLLRFLPEVGSSFVPPDTLDPHVEAAVRASMVERPPWEAEIPFDAISRSGVPTMVVSGGHHPAFDAVCDAIERQLDAHREVITGAGHSVQSTGEPFNTALASFIDANSRPPSETRETPAPPDGAH